MQPHGLYSACNSPGQNTGVGSLSLLQWVFPTQVLNPGLLHCRRILYQLSHKGSPGSSKLNIKRKKFLSSIGTRTNIKRTWYWVRAELVTSQPTSVLLPVKSHGWRSLVGYSPWGCEESDTTERLHFTSLHTLALQVLLGAVALKETQTNKRTKQNNTKPAILTTGLQRTY